MTSPNPPTSAVDDSQLILRTKKRKKERKKEMKHSRIHGSDDIGRLARVMQFMLYKTI